MKKLVTNADRVLEYMKQFGSITSLDAFKDLGNTRLSASIFILRKDYNIKSITVKSKNRYGDEIHYSRYYLVGSDFEKMLIERGVIE